MSKLFAKLGFGSSQKAQDIEQQKKSPKKEESKEQIIEMNKDSKDFDLKKAPMGHQGFSEKDKDKCPFFQMQQTSKMNKTSQSPLSTSSTAGTQSDLNENQTMEDGQSIPKQQQEKVPKGGCPFMPSEKKKNPSLQPMTEAFNEEFISVYGYLLDYQGFFSIIRKNKRTVSKDRQVFDTYPIYLKHTLFFNDDTMKKVRNLEVSQRFFAYDKLKEKGNKHYNRGEFDTALEYYERAFGVFKWLDYVEEQDSDDESENVTNKNAQQQGEQQEELEAKIRQDTPDQEQNKKEDDESTCAQIGENNSEIVTQRQVQSNKIQEKSTTEDEIPLTNKNNKPQKEEEEKQADQELDEEQRERLMEDQALKQMKKHDKQMRQKYKSLMITYSDQNVFLRDGEDLKDAHDIDLRNSMLLNIYMNLASVFMKLNYFKLAEQALSDAMKITDKNSQILFRRSQALSYNKWASLKELEQAKEDIQKAIGMKKYEKIFNSEPGILRILNLENHEEIYIGQAHYTVKRIKERKQFQMERIKQMLEREKQIEEIQAEMIAEGQTPFEGYEVDFQQEMMERQVTNQMLAQYYRIIEFYQETKKPDQVKIAQKELQILCETVNEIEFFMNIDFKHGSQNPVIKQANAELKVDFDNPQILKRLFRIQKERAQEVFDKGGFNFEVFEYALKDYFRKRQEREQLRKQKQAPGKEVDIQAQSKARRLIGQVFSCDFMLQVMLLLALMGAVFYFGRNNSQIKNLFFSAATPTKSK